MSDPEPMQHPPFIKLLNLDFISKELCGVSLVAFFQFAQRCTCRFA